MSVPNVCFKRKELVQKLKQYRLIRHCLEDKVKDYGLEYLPHPDPTDDSEESKVRYDNYKARAVFYNVARRTRNGLAGKVFLRDPVIKIPALLKSVEANATGSGVSLVQLAKKAVNINVAYSRGGLLVDYPNTEADEGASLEDLQSGRIRPTLYVYEPWNVVNWRTVDVGAEEILSLVVIYESYVYSDDSFEIKEAGQYRVLRLTSEGVVHEIWREVTPTEFKEVAPRQGNYVKFPNLTAWPKDHRGEPLSKIPFTFFGAEDNDPEPDEPAFHDLASLNIAHYRNSADYEESCFILGQPTPVAAGLTEEWVANVLKGKLRFGSGGGIPLPAGATAELLQAEANTMIKEAMDTKERQMVALGAKLVEQKSVQRTATEAELEEASESSTLSTSTKNVASAFQWGLELCAEYSGAPTAGIEFTLNTDFATNSLTPEERRQVIEEWQKGAITFEEMRNVLQRAGIATEEIEKARSAIAKERLELAGMEAPVNEPATKPVEE